MELFSGLLNQLTIKLLLSLGFLLCKEKRYCTGQFESGCVLPKAPFTMVILFICKD